MVDVRFWARALTDRDLPDADGPAPDFGTRPSGGFRLHGKRSFNVQVQGSWAALSRSFPWSDEFAILLKLLKFANDGSQSAPVAKQITE